MGIRPSFSNLPYWAGASEKLAVMLSGAALTYKRFLILGDSQETDGAGGINYIPYLNYLGFKAFGPPSELPFFSSVSNNFYFLQSGAGANCEWMPGLPVLTAYVDRDCLGYVWLF
jgi:hypothetical protein